MLPEGRIHSETKQVVAIKSLDLDQQDEDIQDIQKEIGLLSQLKAGDAPNIAAYHGSYVLGHKLWIIMDFCSGGSMRTLVRMECWSGRRAAGLMWE